MMCAACLTVAGIGYAATFTLTTTKLGAASLTTPVLFPDYVWTVNNGNRVGQIQKNDTLNFIWARPIDQTTLCSGWSNAQSTHTTLITWTVNNNTGSTGNDVLVAGASGGACATGLHIGSLDLGSNGYITGSNGIITSASTTVTVNATYTQLTMTIPGSGVTGGTEGTAGSGSAAVWTADSGVADLSGNTCTGCLAKTSAIVQF